MSKMFKFICAVILSLMVLFTGGCASKKVNNDLAEGNKEYSASSEANISIGNGMQITYDFVEILNLKNAPADASATNVTIIPYGITPKLSIKIDNKKIDEQEITLKNGRKLQKNENDEYIYEEFTDDAKTTDGTYKFVEIEIEGYETRKCYLLQMPLEGFIFTNDEEKETENNQEEVKTNEEQKEEKSEEQPVPSVEKTSEEKNSAKEEAINLIGEQLGGLTEEEINEMLPEDVTLTDMLEMSDEEFEALVNQID